MAWRRTHQVVVRAQVGVAGLLQVVVQVVQPVQLVQLVAVVAAQAAQRRVVQPHLQLQVLVERQPAGVRPQPLWQAAAWRPLADWNSSTQTGHFWSGRYRGPQRTATWRCGGRRRRLGVRGDQGVITYQNLVQY